MVMTRFEGSDDRSGEERARAMYRSSFEVPASAIDGNGHVNNVAYVQWMQDVAIEHFEASGCHDAMDAAGGTWVARFHHIEYLSPALLGERLEAQTWVVDFRRVRTLRRYRFVRLSDGQVIAQGETEWAFINTKSGRPMAIPEEIRQAFVRVSESGSADPDGAAA